MYKKVIQFSILFLIITCASFAQEVNIVDYGVNIFGQVQLEINAQSDKYYLLRAEHAPDGGYESVTSMTIGIDGIMNISEPLSAYPLENYTITEHSISDPDDTDFDLADDILEFNNMPDAAPLNFAREIPFVDGSAAVQS